jgi:hypothetical protein
MCDEFGSEEILDHLLGRLAPERDRQIREHLASCASCRSAADGLRPLARLSEAPPVQPRPEVDCALREAIAAEAARRREPRSSTRFNLPAVRRFRLLRDTGTGTRAMAVSLAAAAAILLALATYVLTDRKTSAPPGTPQAVIPETETPAPETPTVRPEPPPPPAPAPEPEPPAPKTETPAPPIPAPPTPAPPAPEPPRPAPTRVEPRAPAGRLLAATGRVDLAGRAAAPGDAVPFGDALLCRTGAALLELSDGSRVALRADTLASLTRHDDDILVRLTRGEVACKVTRREDRFAVETPHGTATVKGTVFSVRTGALTATTVTVTEGRVEARNPRGVQLVPPGHLCSMNGGAPSKPQPVDAEKSLSWAFRQGLRSLGTVWIPAASPNAEFHAPMTAGRFYAEGSLTGLPVYSPSKTYTVNGRANGGWVTYAIEIPEEREWFLWGRFYYPGQGDQIRKQADGTDNDPNSFWVSLDGGDEREFGNLKYDPETKRSFFQRWHWGGDGTIEIGKPAPVPLGRLVKGRHTIRIRERESFEDGEQRLAPRLDMLCLTPDREYVPQDEDARK